MGSFVENVNKLSLNLDTIVKANSTFDNSVLPVLQEVADLDLQEVTEDLQKGNYLGNRKIDVDLSLNKLDSTSIVSYSKADITLVSGEIISIPFLSGASVLELTSHNDIRNYIVNDVLWAGIQYTECTVEESTDTTPTLIRFRDADGHSSNIERVELTVYSGTAQDIRPVYFWAQTTSALQTIANRVGDIIALGNNMSNVIELSQRIDELNELQAELTNLLEIHSNLAEILEADTNAGIATTKAAEALASKIAALQALSDATTQATIATNQAIIATNKANEIKSITTQTATGAAGSLAQVSYNSTDGKLSFVIPQGLKGDRGEAFSVNAMGTFAQRTGYDAQPINFSYFATDMSLIYFKQSATSGDWSTGIPFGKGDTGDTGLTGNGISTIARISGTGAAGSADTYRITYTDGGTFDFTVWNGTDSDVDKAYVDAHKNDTDNPHTVTKAQVGLGNVPNVDATLNIPSGNISSTTVQGAINELDSEKAIDTAVVHKTGDETISGTKTFSSSPIVPTPTNVNQAANKDYVDTNIGQLSTDFYQGPYGFSWDYTTDTYIRTGAKGYTSIQSKMRRCVLNVDGSVKYYLHPDNSNFKEDGTPSVLTGAYGNVMVEIPKHYIKVETVGNVDSFSISLTQEPGYVLDPSFMKWNGTAMVEVPYRYFRAYEGFVSGGKLLSVSGVTPTRSQTIATFRTQAMANGTGWHLTDWNLLNTIKRLCYIEFCDFIVTKYLGEGNHTGSDYGITTGQSNALGNRSSNSTHNDKYMSYRGIENMYADIWEFVDGININNYQAYVNQKWSTFASDVFTGDYVAKGPLIAAGASNSLIKRCNVSADGGFIPTAVGGSTTTFYGDALWSATGAIIALYGGSTGNGASGGLGALVVDCASSYSDVGIGAAVCR